MNVFVLSTGRCGSKTFAKACQHMTNYTASHESQSRWLHTAVKLPYRHLIFPANHIEVDNRLSWFLGTLEKNYGQEAFYVHLLRRREEVAKSLMVRGEQSILFSFTSGILQYFREARNLSSEQRYEIGLQYYATVNDNIELFLRDKPYKMTIWLHDIKDPFRHFWRSIRAEGNLDAAIEEWHVHHNATKSERFIKSTSNLDQWSEQERLTAAEIAAFVRPGEMFVLVDEDQLGRQGFPTDCKVVPFLERNGHYWGVPPESETAIREFERLRQSGAKFMVFAWPAFWWLNYYSDLHHYLNSHFSCRLKNERLIVYDLRQ
jgi:hypothetical protein